MKPKIGVLPLMLEDYLPLFPGIEKKQEDFARSVLRKLAHVAEFTFPGIAKNRMQIQNTVSEFNKQELDGILILPLTYTQGAYVAYGLRDNRLPLALALIQPEQTVRTDFVELDYTVNQAIHGSQDDANCLMRWNIPCMYFAGNHEEAEFAEFVETFAQAAAAAKAVKNMRIGVIGKLQGMGDIYTDDMAVLRELGVELSYDSIGTVHGCCEAVSDEDIRKQMELDRASFVMDSGLPETEHAEAVRMYLGLRKYLEERGLSGYTLHYGHCGEDGRFRQLPLLAASHLLADGYGYAAEGDAMAAILVAAMHKLCGAANFSEMYMMDFARNAILMCHQGEGNWRTCCRDTKPFLKDRVLSEGGLSNPPTLIFTPEPGRACVISLTHVNGRHFRMICAPGNIVETEELAYVDMPYLFFRPDSGVRSCVTRWLEAGGTHHEAIVQGEHMAKIAAFCKLMNIELIQL